MKEYLFKNTTIVIKKVTTIETVRLLATFESYMDSVVKILYDEFLQPRFMNKDFCNTKISITNLKIKLKGLAPFLKKILHTTFKLRIDKLRVIQTWNKLQIINNLLQFKIHETDIDLYLTLMFIDEEFRYFKEKMNDHVLKI